MQIVVDVEPLRRGLAHAVVGKVLYPRAGGGGEAMDEGVLVYVKSALTPADPEDLHEYRRSHLTFPHETTVGQFFDEAQFESVVRWARARGGPARNCICARNLGNGGARRLVATLAAAPQLLLCPISR